MAQIPSGRTSTSQKPTGGTKKRPYLAGLPPTYPGTGPVPVQPMPKNLGPLAEILLGNYPAASMVTPDIDPAKYYPEDMSRMSLFDLARMFPGPGLWEKTKDAPTKTDEERDAESRVQIPGEKAQGPTEDDQQAAIDANIARIENRKLGKPIPYEEAGPYEPLPPYQKRDIAGEGRERQEMDKWALAMPLLSLLFTGNTRAGMNALPYAYTSLDKGQQIRQDREAEENEKAQDFSIKSILDRRSQEEKARGIRNENIKAINEREEFEYQQDRLADQNLLQSRLLAQRTNDKFRTDREREKLNFLKLLATVRPEEQMALWNQYIDRWEEWKMAPAIDPVTGKYVPITRYGDLIAYKNAQTGEARVRAAQSGISQRAAQALANLTFKYAQLATQDEWHKLESEAKVKIASIVKSDAWDRLIYREGMVNARFNDSQALKEQQFYAKTRLKLNSDAGKRLVDLYNRNTQARADLRLAMNGIQAVERNADKFENDRERQKQNVTYHNMMKEAQRVMEETQRQIELLESAMDDGTISAGLVETVLGPDPIAAKQKAQKGLNPISDPSDAGRRNRSVNKRLDGPKKNPTKPTSTAPTPGTKTSPGGNKYRKG